MSYQGWSNYETWNVALWFGNDYGLYQQVLGHRERFTARSARELVRDLLPGGTPDFRGRGGSRAYAKVDWQEIAADFNEMRGEQHSGNSASNGVGESRRLLLPDNLRSVFGTIAHNRPFTIQDLADYGRIGGDQADRIVRQMVRDGLLERTARGQYFPTRKGWQWIESGLMETPRMGEPHYYQEDRGGGPLAVARAELAAHGMSIKKTDWGDYRVYQRGERDPDMGYFTPDLDDAVMTGIAISRGLSERRVVSEHARRGPPYGSETVVRGPYEATRLPDGQWRLSLRPHGGGHGLVPLGVFPSEDAAMDAATRHERDERHTSRRRAREIGTIIPAYGPRPRPVVPPPAPAPPMLPPGPMSASSPMRARRRR